MLYPIFNLHLPYFCPLLALFVDLYLLTQVVDNVELKIQFSVL